MNVFFSASQNSFYNPAWEADYRAAGNWPDDLVELNESVFNEYSGIPPEGKQRGIGSDGLPMWEDIPPLPAEELAAAALMTRDTLLRHAATRISPLQDAVDLDIATDEEKAALTAWKQYRVALNRIEQQPDYPQSIAWPTPPGE